MRVVLVHSPFVGPATWRPVADALRLVGLEVSVPDLRTSSHSWRRFVDACVAELPEDDHVLVGHSGAGALLPSVARPWTGGYLFVDATLPPRSGVLPIGHDWLDRLRRVARDGLLPAWSEIMGAATMEHLVPDAILRDLVSEGARAGYIRGDVAPDELASYCLHALSAASTLRSKAAVRRLVAVTLAGLQPGA